MSIITSNDKSWFALYTKSRSEFKAAEEIHSVGVEYYLPSITRVRQWSDRKKKITEPLLRGYIFIFADERERMISLEQESVVRCIFDFGRPAKIPEWQINNLRLFLNGKSDFFVNEGLIPGEKVLIKDGPFEGVIGTILDKGNEKSIAVSIDLLNRSIVALLPKDSSIEIVKNQNE
ncbi:MAG TPA: UpxY family transcription antiterminator [Ignavibacteriaceae bacterium]|nr:UpxY family transcription antiterminator [Ignavibacteriaceae bacterium]